MELEMEIAGALGDHSYVCARHFLPSDIVVHPNVCRLTANAVPSVFSNYSTNLPRQFFKKVCQTARSIVSVEDPNKLICEDVQEPIENDESRSPEECVQEITVYEPVEVHDALPVNTREIHQNTTTPRIDSSSSLEYENRIAIDYAESSQESRAVFVVSRGTNTKVKYTGVSNNKLIKNKLRKKFRLMETRYHNVKKKLTELENKHALYNLDSLERDAENNNEEAIFLLDMLRSYTAFEDTKKEILSSMKNTNENDSLLEQ